MRIIANIKQVAARPEAQRKTPVSIHVDISAIKNEKTDDVMIADTRNGWESCNFETVNDAERYAQKNKYTEAFYFVIPQSSEWRYDHRDGQWAWFFGGKRLC